MKIKKICIQCGKEFVADDRPNRSQKFCSICCSGKTHEKKVEHKCPICGILFYRQLCQKRTYCSTKCAHKFHTGKNNPNYVKKINGECDFCHKTIVITPSRKNRYEHIYCSRECSKKHRTRLAKEERFCTYCGKKIIRLKCQFRISIQFCNRICSTKYIGEKLIKDNLEKARKQGFKISEKAIIVKCPVCKKEREILRRRMGQRKTEICYKCSKDYFNEKRLEGLRKALIVKRYAKKCTNCGKLLMLTNNQIKNGRLVCNIKCRIELSKNRKECICLNCGKEFIVPISAGGKHCSKKCHYKYVHKKAQKTFICHNCKETFFMRPSDVKGKRKKGSKNFYCTRKCFNKHVKKNTIPVEITRAMRNLNLNYEFVKKYDLIPILELKILQKKLKKEIKNAN